MKKIIIAIIVFIVVMAFTAPIFADKIGDRPKAPFVNVGEVMSWEAQNEIRGTRGAVGFIELLKTQTTIGGVPVDPELNLGQRMKVWHESVRFE